MMPQLLFGGERRVGCGVKRALVLEVTHLSSDPMDHIVKQVFFINGLGDMVDQRLIVADELKKKHFHEFRVVEKLQKTQC